MANFTRPDVYIEEILTPDRSPQGVTTSVAAFVGATERGPANKAIFIDSHDAFVRVFGNALAKESLYYTVRSFFLNGGTACYVVRLVSSAAISGGALPANTAVQADGTEFLKFSAGYRGLPSYGLAGKRQIVEIKASTRFTSQAGGAGDILADGAIGDTSIKVSSNAGLVAGDFIRITDHATSAVSFHTVAGVESRFNTATGQTEYFVDFEEALTANIDAGVNSAIFLMSYDVVVKDLSGNELERFESLSVNPESDTYIETVINDDQVGSRFITVEDLNATLTNGVGRVIDGGFLDNNRTLSTNGEDELSGFVLGDDLVGDEATKTGIFALSGKDSANLLIVPPSLDKTNGIFPTTAIPNVHGAMLDYCATRLDMFAILDTPADLTAASSGQGSVGAYRSSTLGADSFFGALYFPHLKMFKDNKRTSKVTVPPSGAIAGLYARVDAIGAPNGGVASSPAGYGDLGALRGVIDLAAEVSEGEHGNLNTIGVNCIRRIEGGQNALPSTLVLGARTLSSANDFRYINTRRVMLFIEKQVKALGKPYLFRNNGPRLWNEMTIRISNFLSSVYAEGSLAGGSESEAFFVKIDSTTNTAENIQRGILVGEIGVALLRPAEFVVFRFSQTQVGGQE